MSVVSAAGNARLNSNDTSHFCPRLRSPILRCFSKLVPDLLTSIAPGVPWPVVILVRKEVCRDPLSWGRSGVGGVLCLCKSCLPRPLGEILVAFGDVSGVRRKWPRKERELFSLNVQVRETARLGQSTGPFTWTGPVSCPLNVVVVHGFYLVLCLS